MKTILISALFLTLALNAIANEIVGLKSNNPPLSGELAGVKECQLAEVSDDSVVFKSFFYKEKPNGKGHEVYSVITNEQHRIKAFKQPAFTQLKMSVVNPPDKDLFKLTFDGETNKDKSSVLDLSLKLCLSKQKEKELVDINLFLQKELLTAKQVLEQVPQAIRESYQVGFINGLSQKTLASFIQGRQVGQLEGLAVGYEKGAADGLGVGFKMGVVTTLQAISEYNSGSGTAAVQGYGRASKVGFMSDEGAYTPKMKNAVYNPGANVEATTSKIGQQK